MKTEVPAQVRESKRADEPIVIIPMQSKSRRREMPRYQQ